MAETQETISAWADATFGEATSAARVAARANEEMAELIRHALAYDVPTVGPQHFREQQRAVAEECADVVIVLMRLCRNVGCDLLDEIEKKMAKNRARQWRMDGTGHGYHVKPLRPDHLHKEGEKP